jgi:hydrogenase maturation protease
VSDGQVFRARVLCLGNELLADDAFGAVVAAKLRRRLPGVVDVVFTANTGLSLLDYALDVQQLVVVDTILTGQRAPGTLMVIEEGDLQAVPGSSPHYVGLFDALALARAVDLGAPTDVKIIVVEAEDCTTIGGPLGPAVKAAIPEALQLVGEVLAEWDGVVMG